MNKPPQNLEDLSPERRAEIIDRLVLFEDGTSPIDKDVDVRNFVNGLSRIEQRIAFKLFLHADHQRRLEYNSQMLSSTFADVLSDADTNTYFDNSFGNSDAADWLSVFGYEIKRVLSDHGGTSTIYVAEELRLKRELALKVARSSIQKEADYAKFKLEAELQARHLGAGVPAVFGFGLTREFRPYIAMELIQGKNLRELLPSKPQHFSESKKHVKLVGKLCESLAKIHMAGTLHLDLSCNNVILTKENELKILDFGFGKDKFKERPSDEIGGTLPFTAPEKLLNNFNRLGDRYSPDIFSLGAILALVLTGEGAVAATLSKAEKKELIRAGDFHEAHQRLRDAEKNLGVPNELVNIAIRCLQPEPDDRPAHAMEIADKINLYFRNEENELDRLKISEAKRSVRKPLYRAIFAILTVGLIVSTALATWASLERNHAVASRKRAIRNATLRMETLDDVIQKIGNNSLRLAGQTKLQQEILSELIPRFEVVLEQEDLDDFTKEQKGIALNALTVIYRSLHKFDRALSCCQQAEMIFEDLCQRDNTVPARLASLAVAQSNQVVLLAMVKGDLDGAIEKAIDSTSAFEKAIAGGAPSEETYYRFSLAQNNLANCYMQLADSETNETMKNRLVTMGELNYQKSIESCNVSIEKNPKSIEHVAWLAKIKSNFALLIATDVHRKSEAIVMASEAVIVARELFNLHPDAIDARECLAVCLTNHGELLLDNEKLSECLPVLQQAQRLYEGLAKQVPDYSEYPWGSALAKSNVGAALIGISEKNLPEAKRLFEEADEIYRKLITPDTKNIPLKKDSQKNAIRLQNLKDMPKGE